MGGAGEEKEEKQQRPMGEQAICCLILLPHGWAGPGCRHKVQQNSRCSTLKPLSLGD